ADHHSLLTAGQVLFMWGIVLVFLCEKKRLRTAFLTGMMGALAIWVNLEALFFVLIALISLGLYWLKGHRDLLKASLVLSLGLSLGMLIATALEWGPQFFERHWVDTISITYVAVFVLTSVFWAVLWFVDG